MNGLIARFEGNTGGFLDQAVKLADKFIDGDKIIVLYQRTHSGANDEFSFHEHRDSSQIPDGYF